MRVAFGCGDAVTAGFIFFLTWQMRDGVPRGFAVIENEAHATPAFCNDARLAWRERVRDHIFVLVVVYAAYYAVGERLGQVPSQGIVVDEKPVGVLRVKPFSGKVRESDQVVWLKTCWAKDCVELRAEGEVCSGKIGKRNVQSVRRSVSAKICEEEGAAERIEVCSPSVSPNFDKDDKSLEYSLTGRLIANNKGQGVGSLSRRQ